MNDTIDRKTILESGIFAFDDKNKPIGIKGLRPDKNISDRSASVIKIPSHRIKLFAEEIVVYFNSYLKEPQQHETLQSVIDHFEDELTQTLKHWDLDTDNLNPHYSNLLKKSKKIIKSNLKKQTGEMAQVDKKPNLRRDALVARLKRSFDEYIKAPKTNTFYYITHLLIGCGLEKGNYKTVFNKLFTGQNRSFS